MAQYPEETQENGTEEALIDIEVAQASFNKWGKDMALDLDTSVMDAADLTAFQKQQRRLIDAIQNGSLTFNDDGEAVFTPQHEKSKFKGPITFHEGDWATVQAMDGKKENYDVAKTLSIMAAMCKVVPKTFAGLVGPDRKITMALFSLLMD